MQARTTFDVVPNLAVLDDAQALRNAFAGSDVDAILTASVVSSGDKYEYTDYYKTYGILSLLGMSSRNAAAVADIGDVEDYYGQGVLSLNIALWDAKTFKQVWNAVTDSYEMDRGAEGAKRFADFMVDTMAERGFIKL